MNKIIEENKDVAKHTPTSERERATGNTLSYEKPVLKCYGDVRDITLGPSPGVGESGAGVFIFRNS